MESHLNIEWSQKAKADLARIHHYCVQHFSEKVVNKALTNIVNNIDKLSRNPEIGPIDKDFKLKQTPIRMYISTPNRIYYSIRDKTLLVHRIWDARQDPNHFHL